VLETLRSNISSRVDNETCTFIVENMRTLLKNSLNENSDNKTCSKATTILNKGPPKSLLQAISANKGLKPSTNTDKKNIAIYNSNKCNTLTNSPRSNSNNSRQPLRTLPVNIQQQIQQMNTSLGGVSSSLLSKENSKGIIY